MPQAMCGTSKLMRLADERPGPLSSSAALLPPLALCTARQGKT